jgi:hypothetical protein
VRRWVYLYRPTLWVVRTTSFSTSFLRFIFKSIAAPATDPDAHWSLLENPNLFTLGRSLTHHTHTHTPIHTRAYEKVLGKKLSPPRALIPFPSRWCSVLRHTMGTYARDALTKKNSVCPVRGPSRIRSCCPRPLCGPDSSSFFPRFYFFFLLFTRTTRIMQCVCGTVIVRAA